MHLTNLDQLFWAAGFLANLALLCVLWYRGRARRFPIFTALVTLCVARTVVLFVVLRYGTDRSYFFTYWLLTTLDMALQLGVVYELTTRVFRPLQTWIYEAKSNFFWILALSIFVAGGLTSMASPPAHSWMQSLATKGNLFAAALMSELFVAMMVLSVIARLPWQTHVARIAQALGAYSLVSVLIETGHCYFGAGVEKPVVLLLSHLRMMLYLGCVLYWMINLWRNEPPSREMPLEMRERLFTLQASLDYDLQILRSPEKL